MMLCKPARPDLKVLDPVTLKPLPADGAEVEETSSYWARRIQDGDVVAVDPKPKKGGL